MSPKFRWGCILEAAEIPNPYKCYSSEFVVHAVIRRGTCRDNLRWSYLV